MAEICLNANAARPYGACVMPVRRFAAASRCEARTYGCGASPLLTLPHAAGMQICSCEKCQRRELSCLLWQSVEQERAPVPLSGLRCQKVYKPRTKPVLWVPCCLFPRTTAALRLCARDPCNPTSTLQMCSQKLSGKGEEKKSCWCYPSELCFLW